MTSPTEFSRNFGMSSGLGGWLLFPFLQKIGEDEAQKHRITQPAKVSLGA